MAKKGRGKKVATGIYKQETKQGLVFMAQVTYTFEGKKRFETKKHSTKKAAIAWRAKRKWEVDSGKGLPEPTQKTNQEKTLAYYLTVMREKKRRLRSPVQPMLALDEIEQFFGSESPQDVVNDLAVARYENHIDSMKPKSKRRGPISAQTKKHYLQPYKELVRAISRDLRLPCPEFRKVSGEKGMGAKRPTEEQFRAFVNCLSPVNKAAAFLMVVTAQRRTDAMTIRWSDIRQVGGQHIIHFRNSKTQRTGFKIPAPPELLEALSHVPRRPGVDFVFWNPKTKKPIKDMKTAFASASRRAGLPITITNHSFRKFATQQAVKTIKDVRLVAQMFGWSSPKLVEEVYSQADVLAEDVAENMGNILRFAT